MQIQNERRPLDHLKSFAFWCHVIYLMQNYLIERFSYDLEMKTREQNRSNKRTEMSDLIGLSNGYKRAWLLIG